MRLVALRPSSSSVVSNALDDAGHSRAVTIRVGTLTDRASDQRETLEMGCRNQPIVERDEGGLVLEFFLKMDTTGQVNGVPGTQRVAPEEGLRPGHDRGREFHDE